MGVVGDKVGSFGQEDDLGPRGLIKERSRSVAAQARKEEERRERGRKEKRAHLCALCGCSSHDVLRDLEVVFDIIRGRNLSNGNGCFDHFEREGLG